MRIVIGVQELQGRWCEVGCHVVRKGAFVSGLAAAGECCLVDSRDVGFLGFDWDGEDLIQVSLLANRSSRTTGKKKLGKLEVVE